MKRYLKGAAFVLCAVVIIGLFAWAGHIKNEELKATATEWRAYIRDNGCVVSIDDSWKTCWKCSLPREHEVCR